MKYNSSRASRLVFIRLFSWVGDVFLNVADVTTVDSGVKIDVSFNAPTWAPTVADNPVRSVGWRASNTDGLNAMVNLTSADF